MGHRFEGAEGKRRLVEALCSQVIVSGNEQLAAELAEALSVRETEQGTEIITQDSFDSDLFFILVGEASVFINGREVARRSAGTHVGEMSLIDPTAKRSATVKTTESSIVGVIAEDKFSAIANRHPELWRRAAIELANRLRQRSKFHRQPNDKPMVFIGSSRETLDIAEAVKSAITSDNVIVKVWTEGIFRASRTSVESLEAVLHTFDFGVVVFGPDDIVESRTETKPAPRDNTVFELGLLMGGIGRGRTFIIRARGADLKIPSDLFGITCLTVDSGDANSLQTVAGQLRAEITRLGPR